MSNKTIFFGYVSFLREKVDAAMEIMSKRANDYLWICFNPSRVVQDGPTEEHPNMSFSIILETDDPDDIVSDIETVVRQLPFLSCTLVVKRENQDTVKVLTYDTTGNFTVKQHNYSLK